MEKSYNVSAFCAAEEISRGMLYLLWKRGKGPRFYYLGRIRRITEEARLQWQREREAETMKSMEVA